MNALLPKPNRPLLVLAWSHNVNELKFLKRSKELVALAPVIVNQSL